MRNRYVFAVVPVLFLLSAGGACRFGNSQTAGPAAVDAQAPGEPPVPMPNKAASLKFGVLGDFGSGSRQQYEMAAEMAKVYQTFKFEMVATVGDNLYGSQRPQDFATKFERPYKVLLDGGVKFYASLGNHDAREQRYYKPFNMEGKLYYTFKAPKESVRFFMLESTYPEPEQIAWIEKELQGANDDWKIAAFHHPLYSSGSRHGSDIALRKILEPLFIKYNVSVVLTGHDHLYERTKPQNGIPYFVIGSGGQLREGTLLRNDFTAKGFDTDLAFMIAEISGDEMVFNVISRTGRIVDSGTIQRRKPQTVQ